jgi:hypothetical protein
MSPEGPHIPVRTATGTALTAAGDPGQIPDRSWKREAVHNPDTRIADRRPRRRLRYELLVPGVSHRLVRLADAKMSGP